MSKLPLNNYLGCILGGAIGDALGAPTEFLSLSEIKRKYGYQGVSHYVEFDDDQGEITDDTQMTLFTAEAMLASQITELNNGEGGTKLQSLFNAYQRWYDTQMLDFDRNIINSSNVNNKIGLANVREMYKCRAPGLSCLFSLENSRNQNWGTVEYPINNSKGCGGIMRVAPIGLIYHDSIKSAFDEGVKAAALTHGHPDGYLPAGVLTSIIASINNGSDLMQAIENSIIELRKYERHETTESAINKAIRMYESHEPNFENVEKLGGGWVGEEALSIALFCALHYQTDFKKGIILAINHSGDTDSTGSITGNILGLLLGQNAIPKLWLNNLNMKKIISDIATQLYSENKSEELLFVQSRVS